MKFVCSKSNLLTGVQTVAKAVPSKTTMSILECILIEADNGNIILTANDMELGIETIIEGDVLVSGKIALDAKIFLEIVRKLPDNDITIETDDNNKTTIIYFNNLFFPLNHAKKIEYTKECIIAPNNNAFAKWLGSKLAGKANNKV